MYIRTVSIKDHADLSIDIGNVRISACDVDHEGFVENVDVIVDGELKLCVNIQTDENYGWLVYYLFQTHGKIRPE